MTVALRTQLRIFTQEILYRPQRARYDFHALAMVPVWEGLEMFNSRYTQPLSRELLAEMDLCRRIFVAHSVMASGIGEVLSGFVVLSSDPGGGSGV